MAAEESSPLVANGLLEQVFAQVNVWLDSLAGQINAIGNALVDISLLGDWWRTSFTDPAARDLAWSILGTAVVILLAAGLAEWLVRYLVRRPRRLLARDAARRYADVQQRMHDKESALEAVLADPVVTDRGPPITVEAAAAASPPPTPPVAAPQAPALIEAGMVPTDAVRISTSADGSLKAHLRERRKAAQHWGLLRRTPYAVADALLVLVPLLAFLAVAALLTRVFGDIGRQTYPYVLVIVGAYAGVRIALAVVRLFASPAGQSMRLLHMSDAGAHYTFKWAVAILAVTAVGVTLGEVVLLMGARTDVHTFFMKLTSLIAHAMLVIVVIQTRRPVSARIRGESGDGAGEINGLRKLLADIWPVAAVSAIVVFWFIWALSVANGFQRALYFLATTAGVLIVSRLLWILGVGALDRSFEKSDPLVATGIDRYHALVRHLVSVAIGIATAVVLLQAWGIDALSWFEPQTVGRRLLSATITILVAAILAIAVWEAVSLALRRRINTWTASGDTMRAARLRTLVPMIRTILLVVIGLIVIMTALNELGVNTAPLLAGASIIGVALGFGSQKLVQDFINGIFLLMENAMQVGDTVTLAGVSGKVEYLSIRTVHLRAGDGSLHVVPFSSVATVTNVNRGQGNASVRLNLIPDTDIDAVYAELRGISAAMRSDPKFGPMMRGDLDIWGVDQIDGSAITIAGQIPATDSGRWPVQREFNRRVLARFRESGVTLTNPRETVLTQPPVAGPEKVE